MKRRTFMKNTALTALGLGIVSSTSQSSAKFLDELSENLNTNDSLLPSFFIGHGNPMNGIEENHFSKKWQALGQQLEKPQLILCVSAHWLTRGTFITAMDSPRTIHDFGAFAPELFNVQYNVKGAPEQARKIAELISPPEVHLDNEWGLDHGSWTIIRHMFPNADVPVIQLSISLHESGEYHYQIGQKLSELRKKGVLIIGSGNIVHNLRRTGLPEGVPMTMKNANYAYGHDWAIEANELIKSKVFSGDHQSLFDYKKLGSAVKLAVPTPDHYYPLLYTLGTQLKDEEITLFNDQCIGGSVSMSSFQIG